MRKLASTMVYAAVVHCSDDTDAPRSRRIDGNATLTIVTSIPTISRLMQQIASTSQGRARVTGSPAAGGVMVIDI